MKRLLLQLRWQRWRSGASSLRVRLLVGTAIGVSAALLVAGLVLADLFRVQVQRQFEAGLRVHLDQLTASFDVAEDGHPVLVTELAGGRWRRPFSGLYWQIDQVQTERRGTDTVEHTLPAVLRSRSLWDATLTVPLDVVQDGSVHVHTVDGPQGQRLMVLERRVRASAQGDAAVNWLLRVAQDTHEMDEAVAEFVQALVISLLVLALALLAAAVGQVAVGLAPLRKLEAAVTGVRQGRLQRLEGTFPDELQPLIDDFNAVLDQNAQIIARARTQAGNLAHAIKTPLAVLANAASQGGQQSATDLAHLIDEQVAQARRQVNWHLARARAAASVGVPGVRTEIAPVVESLVRVMDRVHAERHLDFDNQVLEGVVKLPGQPSGAPPASLASLAFAGEEQDLQEMLGNLLDNACKWALSSVRVSAVLLSPPSQPSQPVKVNLIIEDDGPGVAESWQLKVLERGSRADEHTPGSGLGLAIVNDLAQLYGGSIVLDASPELGGLRVCLCLPVAMG